ncbi:O-acetyl-ADP-ribose deacetylase [Pollutibacter soli]|uniref:O-acetyl-ADP-ribose deacetylase n=1 Tax=Pollutibacter soli TaxID=3034157 RepID=UPI00301367DA
MKNLRDRLELTIGDITKIPVDAIVNAANRSLLGGGGVDGAIHRAGGPAILEECKKIRAARGGCDTGDAVVTTAGLLPAKWVIHTVGPYWKGGQNSEAALLASCYRKSLKLAAGLGCENISFPNISTGVYGYPKEAAASIALDAIAGYVAQETLPSKIILVCFDQENHSILQLLINQ